MINYKTFMTQSVSSSDQVYMLYIGMDLTCAFYGVRALFTKGCSTASLRHSSFSQLVMFLTFGRR